VTSAIPTVLVLRALGLGDALTGIPALRGLRRAFPEHRLTLAAPSQLGQWLRRLDVVDAVLPTPDLQPLPRWLWTCTVGVREVIGCCSGPVHSGCSRSVAPKPTTEVLGGVPTNPRCCGGAAWSTLPAATAARKTYGCLRFHASGTTR